jgi:hypothetical protein
LQQRARHLGVVFCCLLSMAAGGCEFFTGEKKAAPRPLEYELTSPYKGVRTLAVAPAINQSGSRDFDVLSVSDSLFEELQQVGGLNVLPLNKTLAAMQRLGIRTIDSPLTAQRIAEFLGADALIVPAITAYYPYNPPKVGMVLQMYTPRRLVKGDANVTGTPQGAGTIVSERQPVSQVEGVFDSSNQSVLKELRDYAQGRTQYDSALQDQKFLMDADAYTRFVCHAMVRRLMEVERARATDR